MKDCKMGDVDLAGQMRLLGIFNYFSSFERRSAGFFLSHIVCKNAFENNLRHRRKLKLFFLFVAPYRWDLELRLHV
jgi:hypothetical protein